MGKSGHKTGKGMLADDNITAEQLIQNAKEQAAGQKQSAFASSLQLEIDGPGSRLWVWTIIDGVKVKRFVDPKDTRRYDAHNRNEDGSAIEKAYQKIANKSSNRNAKRRGNRRK